MGSSKENGQLIDLAMEVCGWGIVCEEFLESDPSVERFEYLVKKLKDLCDQNKLTPSQLHLREALMKVRYSYRQFIRQIDRLESEAAQNYNTQRSNFELQMPESIRNQAAEHYRKHLHFEHMLRRARLEYSHKDYKQACFACLKLLENGKSVLHDKSRAIVELLVLAVQKSNSEDFDESVQAITKSCMYAVGPSFDDDRQRLHMLDWEEKNAANLSRTRRIHLATQRHALLSPIRLRAYRAVELLLQETILETGKRAGFTSQQTERLRYLLFCLEVNLGSRIWESRTNYRVYANRSLKTMSLLKQSTHSHSTWEMIMKLASLGKNLHNSLPPELNRYYIDYACRLAMNLRQGDLKALNHLLDSTSNFAFIYARRRRDLVSDTLDQIRVICQLFFENPQFKDPMSSKIQHSCFESLVKMTRVSIARKKYDCINVFLNCLQALPKLSQAQLEQLANFQASVKKAGSS